MAVSILKVIKSKKKKEKTNTQKPAWYLIEKLPNNTPIPSKNSKGLDALRTYYISMVLFFGTKKNNKKLKKKRKQTHQKPAWYLIEILPNSTPIPSKNSKGLDALLTYYVIPHE